MDEIVKLATELTLLNGEIDTQTDQYQQLSQRRTEVLRQLRELVVNGQTVGDPLSDAVIVNYGSAAAEAFKYLKQYQDQVNDHLGQVVLVVETNRIRRLCHSAPHERLLPEIDFNQVTTLRLGTLCRAGLAINPNPYAEEHPPLNVATALGDLHFIGNLRRRLIGFPTANYVRADDRSMPQMIEGDLFPAQDIVFGQMNRVLGYELWTPAQSTVEVVIGDQEVEEWFKTHRTSFTFLNLMRILGRAS